jgi:uncharacterized protein YeaO (DUF488 family)
LRRGHAPMRKPKEKPRKKSKEKSKKKSKAKAKAPRARANKTKSAAAKSAPRRAGSIAVKRAYDPPAAGDGLRILIDRLWPRGVSKAKLRPDAWVKDLAPSNALRKWYQHDPAKFAAFRERYRAELAGETAALRALRALVKGRKVTLLTATKELDLSHGTVLRELLARA